MNGTVRQVRQWLLQPDSEERKRIADFIVRISEKDNLNADRQRKYALTDNPNRLKRDFDYSVNICSRFRQGCSCNALRCSGDCPDVYKVKCQWGYSDTGATYHLLAVNDSSSDYYSSGLAAFIENELIKLNNGVKPNDIDAIHKYIIGKIEASVNLLPPNNRVSCVLSELTGLFFREVKTLCSCNDDKGYSRKFMLYGGHPFGHTQIVVAWVDPSMIHADLSLLVYIVFANKAEYMEWADNIGLNGNTDENALYFRMKEYALNNSKWLCGVS